MVSPAVNIISYVTAMNFLQDPLNNFELTLGTADHNKQQCSSELDHMLFWYNIFIYFVIEFCIMFSAKCHSSPVSIFLCFWTMLWSLLLLLLIISFTFPYIFLMQCNMKYFEQERELMRSLLFFFFVLTYCENGLGWTILKCHWSYTVPTLVSEKQVLL